MHDHAIARRHEVHDLAHRRSSLITSDHQSSRKDLASITSLVEECPDVAGLILIVQVSGDIHQLHLQSSQTRSAWARIMTDVIPGS